MIRYQISFTGRVQGVGFRFTTCRVAQGHAVAGWVRNEADGSVTCVAEGEAEELDRFVAAVRDAMSGSVRDAQVRSAPATGEFAGFAVKH